MRDVASCFCLRVVETNCGNFSGKYGFFFFFSFLYADYTCCFWFGILYERLKKEKQETKFEFEKKKKFC